MRLKHIKLVGFKSFVDPTKVPFPDQMTCVVGPNGCGKSNVIDAVRWVLGESSAKNLRGDAMSDVIFNGSSARKPVSQASVELVFDNSSGRIQGEYAAFNEISVKRLVTRDGQSNYFLNGSRCRRRDITDLFLGTGLGPRSYAIIEQGMISRLIESRPQELRVFIEEAAGISKYKERRKETENRMLHTRENLERLSDVREELGQQLEKLERQAAAAIRYKELKASERKFKGELQALRWLKLDNQRQQLQTQYAEQQTELERWQAQQSGDERGAIELKEQAEEARDRVELSQEQMFSVGNEITRIEQTLKHQQELKEQRSQRQQQLNEEIDQLNEQLADDRLQREQLEEQQLMLEPQLEQVEEQMESVAEQSQQANEKWRQWQQQQRQQQQQQRDVEKQQQQAQLKLQQLKQSQQYALQQVEQFHSQQQELQQQEQALSVDENEQALVELKRQLEQEETRYQHSKQQLQALQQGFKEQQQQHRQNQQQQDKAQAQLTAIEQLLEGKQNNDSRSEKWLQQNYPDSLKVRELLQAESGWEMAVEQLAYDWLDAVVLEQTPEELKAVSGVKLVWPVSGQEPENWSLASKVKGPLRYWAPLQQCLAIEQDADAKQQLQQSNASFAVSKTGNWYWQDGFIAARVDEDNSVLHLQTQRQNLLEQLQVLASRLSESETQLEQTQTQVEQAQEQLEQVNEQVQQTRNEQGKVEERLQWNLQQAEQIQQQLMSLRDKQQEQRLHAENAAEQQQQIEMQLEEYELLLEQTEQVDEDYGEQLESTVRAEDEQLQQLRSQQQQMTMQQQNLQAQAAQLQKLLQRSEQRYQQLRQERSEQQTNETDENQSALDDQLTELLDKRGEVSEQLQEQRQQLSRLEHDLQQITQGQSAIQVKISQAKEAMQSTEIEQAKLQERSQAVLETLAETGLTLKNILEELSSDADEKQWQQELESIQNKIKRLGAINLAAIDEAEAQRERKQYLDQQVDDLSSALDTLEAAIRKIDKETRHRFKTTFDAINHDLQILFPKVFGGGSATLELTDDDLLETGVTIMARPPGKKNSTIHLLSGGEKALTALSLVFAIFRLNPAPFCLLDEVDAPLDDANVGRFCRLVSEMSESVQFIYISHNKVAMEMATHLAGVTMQEAGVSRLVAVDVEQAVAMTDAG
ncbi:UNVERIFIED_ORG: condensin subunit Smc [Idiomarina abyssalis]|jgi:chromosome segregation protein|uniref:Chromosome partition protein Smc n=1 Tax=Idiomarina loihiensis (strain ATCC BAA-735 / DSM 15497 / L2-TR) TaxID=283942 RepID=Q5QUJ9_IDILO|nr:MULTISPECIES: chromosome segregation protein SMC [Idiomarina]AAV82535.1 Chromosome segregation ATPase, sms [Idiomarina loihiensis L2TR]AGM36576.1 chromosome segregation ATPase, sms [Idiomarina loihiensis GSL 199]TDO53976.1 condensin subunit Smc [Idiomarina sp. 017G]